MMSDWFQILLTLPLASRPIALPGVSDNDAEETDRSGEPLKRLFARQFSFTRAFKMRLRRSPIDLRSL